MNSEEENSQASGTSSSSSSISSEGVVESESVTVTSPSKDTSEEVDNSQVKEVNEKNQEKLEDQQPPPSKGDSVKNDSVESQERQEGLPRKMTSNLDIFKMNITPYDGTSDFAVWKFRVMCYFKETKLDKVLDGSRSANDGEEERINSVLAMTLGSNQLAHIISVDGAKAKWDKLLEIHEASGEDAIQRLTSEFYRLSFGGKDMSTFLSEINNIVSRLKAAGSQYAIPENLVIESVLNKLPVEYETKVVSWQSTAKSERTFTNLSSQLLREESRLRERGMLKVGQSDGQAFVTKGSRKPLKCFCCGQVGHKANVCPDKGKSTGSRGNQSRKGKPGRKQEGQGRSQDESSNRRNENSFAMFGLTMGEVRWLADSGSSRHVCSVKEWFDTFQEDNGTLAVADGHRVEIKGHGTVKVKCGHDGVIREMKDVAYAPSINFCLFSVSAVESKGFEVSFKSGECRVLDNQGDVKALGHRINNLYVLDFEISGSVNLVKDTISLETWHRRLGHVHLEKVMKTINWKGVKPTGMDCEGCILGKMHRKSFIKDDKKRAKYPGELVHVDLNGPMSVKSPSGARYFMLFKDDYSGMNFVYFLREKEASHVVPKLKQFLLDWKFVNGDRKVFRLRSDNGTEFTGHKFLEILEENGIRPEYITPNNSEQNGFIERAMRTISESARSMLFGAKLETFLWQEAVSTAVHVQNRIPSLKGTKSPMELCTGEKPSIDHLRELGSKVFVLDDGGKRKKWDAKAKPMILVGYNSGNRSYRCWDGRRIVSSLHVNIIEPVPLSKVTLPCPETGSAQEEALQETQVEKDTDEDEFEDATDQEEGVSGNSGQSSSNLMNSSQPAARKKYRSREVEPLDEELTSTRSAGQMYLRNQGRQTYNQSVPRVEKSNGNPSLTGLSALCFMVSDDPGNYKEAVMSPESDSWKSAMDQEMDSLMKNKTWTLVPRKPEMNVIGSKWVYCKKFKSDGTINKFKARLVAQGFKQKSGIDFEETFSPVVRYDTVRILLSLVPSRKLKVSQFDVRTAFLNGDLDEEIFMEEPHGYGKSNGTKVCRLEKAIYGLKQASRSWNFKFTDVMKNFGMKPTHSDPCVFVNESRSLILALYVDDGLIIWSHKQEKDALISLLESKFEITTSDGTNYAGMEIKYDKDSVFIHQQNYCRKVIERFGMNDCSPVSTPAESHVKLSKPEEESDLKVPYRELVGSLMYLAIVSRPDIAYAVSVLSQFMTNFNAHHWTAGKRVLRYLAGTSNLGITYGSTGSRLTAFSDSDFAGCVDSRRSRTGNLIVFNGGPVIWKSQRQPLVAHSSTEAEFMAADSATTSVKWIRMLLDEIGFSPGDATLLYVDNMSAITLIKNPQYHHRSKHIDIRYKYIRERYQEGLINLQYVNTKDQVADLLTKPLPLPAFKYLISHVF